MNELYQRKLKKKRIVVNALENSKLSAIYFTLKDKLTFQYVSHGMDNNMISLSN